MASEDRFRGAGLTYRLPKLEEISAKRVVIVGGGDSAVDTALSLERVADVTLVHRREALRAFAHSQARLRDSGVREGYQNPISHLTSGSLGCSDALLTPLTAAPVPEVGVVPHVQRRDLLGGLIHEYDVAA